jgi:3-oxoacyl-ACP reductase-like protein
MQPIRDRLISQLKAKGMPAGKAAAVATKTLQKSGALKKGSIEPTKKGLVRTKMGAAGRAKDRAAKETGRSASDFKYNQLTNRARLKK